MSVCYCQHYEYLHIISTLLFLSTTLQVADFWREAHLLGQLHHPNIMAFYGVVRDGPVTNLATVTEYMVNGSLQQVLRRKDRYGIQSCFMVQCIIHPVQPFTANCV